MKAFSEEEDLPAPFRVAEQLKQQIADFQAKLPLVNVLCNKGMRERHWVQVSEILGTPVKPDATTALQSLLALNLEPHLEKLEEARAHERKRPLSAACTHSDAHFTAALDVLFSRPLVEFVLTAISHSL
eukprot:4024644-Pleurochrysis_carterae.AAC.1